jgi:hypothetical protein
VRGSTHRPAADARPNDGGPLGRVLAADYFTSGVFARARPGELFARLACVECGHVATTWAAFRAHRAHRPPCRQHPELWGGRVTPVEALAPDET